MLAIVNRATVEEYLARHDFVVARVADDTWRGTFPAAAKSFRFFVRLAPGWLHFTVTPLLDERPGDAAAARALFERLLRLNGEIRLAKFALDAAGEVVLGVDLPTLDLDFSEFHEALEALRHYAAAHHDELASLAHGSGNG